MANELRLIKADSLMERFRIVAQSGGPVVVHVSDICAAIEDEVYETTMDFVEVVRCEHCVHSLSDGWICGGPSFTMPSHPTYPDAFCSYGERSGNG